VEQRGLIKLKRDKTDSSTHYNSKLADRTVNRICSRQQSYRNDRYG